MNPDSPLARLADACGIEAGYHDIWGTWHALSEDTARCLLAAMGVDVADDHAVEASLHARLTARWMTLAPPVCLVRMGEGEAACLPLAFSADDEQAIVSWRIRAEDGAEHRGELVPADLALIEDATVDGQQRRLRRFDVPAGLPPGYYEATFTTAGVDAVTKLIVTPHRCHQPPTADSERGRPWGIALQLYGVRSERNWGIGDLGDLARATELFGTLGADLVATNPLHALFFDEPERASPYSPSARCFANPLYLDVEAIPEFDECGGAAARVAAPDFQAELRRLRAGEFVDYGAVAKLKRDILAELYAHFHEHHLSPGSPRAARFREFQQTKGSALRRYAVFEALHEKLGATAWPAEFLDPDSSTVADFTRTNLPEIEFHEYLQWLLAAQIARVQDVARANGMRIGLYGDLAVGSDAYGADVWDSPQAYARDVSIGAPPDDFSLQGQVWGLPPWLPHHLIESGFDQYINMLRANMQDHGALRIDHVIGLQRLFWVPAGADATHGAYVRYPLYDLLAVLALESVRARCVVIGEDLGTVSDEVRAALHDYGLLSYRVVYFSKHWHGDHSFIAPREFPPQSLVTVGTHDLPTLAGFWSGHDLRLRESLDLFPDAETRDRLCAERELDRTRLLEALDREGLKPGSAGDRLTPALAAALHRYTARALSALMVVQMEDVLGELEQVNVPGTVFEQPNWRRRLELPLERWSEHGPLRELAAHLATERRWVPTD